MTNQQVIKTQIVKDTDTGEYQVKAYTTDGRYTAADYFTDDKADAKDTAERMTRHVDKAVRLDKWAEFFDGARVTVRKAPMRWSIRGAFVDYNGIEYAQLSRYSAKQAKHVKKFEPLTDIRLTCGAPCKRSKS